MFNTIESIYRYPIKGLSGEQLENVEFTADTVIPGDREYAFARAGVNFDPDNPQYMQKTNFLALVRDAKLALLETKFNTTSRRLSLSRDGIVLIEASLSSREDCQKISDFLSKHLNILPVKQPHLVRATDGTKSHSFSDVRDKAISLISLSSIEDFSARIGVEVDPKRFRGNINFRNNTPWQEFNWVDCKLRIGGAVLNVFKRIKRCNATSVNPFSAVRDINVPRELNTHYHHTDMGVYATVKKSGVIRIGDKIELV